MNEALYMAKKVKKVKVMKMSSSKSKDIVNQAMTAANKTGLAGIMGNTEWNMFGKRQKR